MRNEYVSGMYFLIFVLILMTAILSIIGYLDKKRMIKKFFILLKKIQKMFVLLIIKFIVLTEMIFTIEEAKRGEYHDYKNEKYVCGKVALCSLLEDAGLYALSARVKDGEFDESPDEQDKLMMEKDFPGLFKRK